MHDLFCSLLRTSWPRLARNQPLCALLANMALNVQRQLFARSEVSDPIHEFSHLSLTHANSESKALTSTRPSHGFSVRSNISSMETPPADSQQQPSTAAMSTSGRTRRSRSSRPSSSPTSRSVPVASLPGRTGLSAGRMICMELSASPACVAELTPGPQPNPRLQLQHEREDHLL